MPQGLSEDANMAMLQNIGGVLMLVGMAMEVLGALSLVSYPIRRRLLPMGSPMTLLGFGAIAFVAGNILRAIGAVLT